MNTNNNINLNNYTYFNESDFNRCTPQCSIRNMDHEFMKKLDLARDMAQVPFILTSAYRDKEWEIAKNRTGKGAHTQGCAVDISCISAQNRFKLIDSLLQIGINRIGIGSDFIHVDNSPSLMQNVIWTY